MQHLFQPARIMPIKRDAYASKNISVDVLRLDEIHPVISGNKWFKLKVYLEDAEKQQRKVILTFGGAWSNHIVATAAMCSMQGFASIGIIRGEAATSLSPTLLEAQRYGMRLFFISREAYKNKTIPREAYEGLKKSDIYVINEGGYGEKGAEGSMDILKSWSAEKYTHLVAAAGTGTMLAGLINASQPQQQVIGISVLKNNVSIESAIQPLLFSSKNNFQIRHQFHFGRYAKHTPELLRFMNEWHTATRIPTDFVYTAKMFYAADQLLQNNFFKSGDSILLIHSGGRHGNRSLPAGALSF